MELASHYRSSFTVTPSLLCHTAAQYTAVGVGVEAQSAESTPKTNCSVRLAGGPGTSGALVRMHAFPTVPCEVSQTLGCRLPSAYPHHPHPQSPGLLAGWLSCDMEELAGLHGYRNPLVWEEPNEVQGWQCELPPALGTMWYWYVGCFLDLF